MGIMAFTLTYNVALVMFGAGVLGVAAGVTGTFMFLRKRALLSDAISHATLPGLCGVYGDGRLRRHWARIRGLIAWLCDQRGTWPIGG